MWYVGHNDPPDPTVRTVTAPDGAEIYTRRNGSRGARSWIWTWWVGNEVFVRPMADDCVVPVTEPPTDAEVLADYAAWKGGQK